MMIDCMGITIYMVMSDNSVIVHILYEDSLICIEKRLKCYLIPSLLFVFKKRSRESL